MTSEDAWQVARRVLGVYFVVEGLLYATGALSMLGIVVPEGSSRAGYVSAALLQGVIGVVAGAVLLRSSTQSGVGAAPSVDRVALKQVALQLLGVFFLVRGAASVAGAAAGAMTVTAGWMFRSAEFAAAVIELVAGGLLIMRSRQVSTVLESHDGA